METAEQEWQNKGERLFMSGKGYTTGISHFKESLKKTITKERDFCKELLDAGFSDMLSEERCMAKYEFCNSLLNKIIDEIKPIDLTTQS